MYLCIIGGYLFCVIKAVESRIAARKTGESISSTRAAFLDLLLDLKDSGADLPMQTILDESNIFINAVK